MADEKKFKTFKEFWPEYLRLHSRPITRGVHYTGTLAGIGLAATGIGLAIAGVATGGLALLAAAPLVTYGVLFPSHFIFEKNNPATLKNPFLSMGGDFKLLFCFLTGRIRNEYEKAGLDFTGKSGDNKNTPVATAQAAVRDKNAPSPLAAMKSKLGTSFARAKTAVKSALPKARPAPKQAPSAPRP